MTTSFYELRFSCYKVQRKRYDKNQLRSICTDQNSPVTNKKQRSTNQTIVIDRMADSKIKGKTVINSKKAGNKYRIGEDIILNNRTESSRDNSTKTQCQMRISLVLNPVNGRWFLHDNTSR